MWNDRYEDLLVEWAKLREHVKPLPIEDALHLIHDWWNHAPITGTTIHITDPDAWPGPWDLLSQNAFSDLERCLGMCYTILLLEREDIKSLQVVQTDNYSLVQINNGQYTLNDEPGNITMDQNELQIRFLVDANDLKINL